MAVMSPPILVANSDAQVFQFKGSVATCNVQVRFFSDDAGTVEIAPGTGSRDITATTLVSAYEGPAGRPTAVVTDVLTDLELGTLAAAVDGVEYALDFGSGVPNVRLVAAPNTTPGGAVTYRVYVESVANE